MVLLAAVAIALAASPGWPQTSIPVPRVTFDFGSAKEPTEVALPLKILLGLVLVSLAPAIVMTLTSFTRIIIILSFLRTALGTHQAPPTPVLVGFALFLTMFVMFPTWRAIDETAVQPYVSGAISFDEALRKGIIPLRDFMLRQTREKDLALFLELGQAQWPQRPEQIPVHILIPSFVISELKAAFQIGFVLYIPFLVIDLVVASTLMSVGMLMLPPVMISLPFKILLFVMVDGWHLLTRSIVMSFL